MSQGSFYTGFMVRHRAYICIVGGAKQTYFCMVRMSRHRCRSVRDCSPDILPHPEALWRQGCESPGLFTKKKPITTRFFRFYKQGHRIVSICSTSHNYAQIRKEDMRHSLPASPICRCRHSLIFISACVAPVLATVQNTYDAWTRVS